MGQVTVTLNGRSYRLKCGDGEERRLTELADHLSLRLERLAMDFGHPGDERLLVMAALLATDELLDARLRLKALEAGSARQTAESTEALSPDAGGPLEPSQAASEPAEATDAEPPTTPEASPPAEAPAVKLAPRQLAPARPAKPAVLPG